MVGGTIFSQLFGSSPLKPLQSHMKLVNDCMGELQDLMAAANKGDFDTVAKKQESISSIELEAGKLKRELQLHLPKSLFMPVDRRDLVGVLSVQSKLGNTSKDIAGLVLGRKMQLPEAIQEDYLKFLSRCADAVRHALKTVDELDELVETGFGGREVELIQNLIKELDTIEDDTDQLQIDIRAKLFAMEEALKPVDVMFLYSVIHSTGKLADLAQRMGSRLQLIIAK